jgi:hypothetical protein
MKLLKHHILVQECHVFNIKQKKKKTNKKTIKKQLIITGFNTLFIHSYPPSLLRIDSLISTPCDQLKPNLPPMPYPNQKNLLCHNYDLFTVH